MRERSEPVPLTIPVAGRVDVGTVPDKRTTTVATDLQHGRAGARAGPRAGPQTASTGAASGSRCRGTASTDPGSSFFALVTNACRASA